MKAFSAMRWLFLWIHIIPKIKFKKADTTYFSFELTYMITSFINVKIKKNYINVLF
jgi:hypothetical protein